MLFQVLLNIFAFVIKLAAYVIVCLVAIPFGIYMVLIENFRSFVLEYGFGFWSVFIILTLIAYIILWKPILWLVGTLGVLGAGN
jgi:hypothetical protein